MSFYPSRVRLFGALACCSALMVLIPGNVAGAEPEPATATPPATSAPTDAAASGQPADKPNTEPTSKPDPSGKESPQAEALKWRSLFDGKTLKHWKPIEFGGEGEVSVKDGAIVAKAGQPMTGVVWTGEAIPKSNYELRMEAKRIEGNDFFLAWTFPVQESQCSLVLGGWGGGVLGISSINGFDASENDTTLYENFQRGEWYKVRVRVTDHVVQAWLNDERIINIPTDGTRFSVRIEVDECRPFGIASYMTDGAYRKIEIRDLKAEERSAPAE